MGGFFEGEYEGYAMSFSLIFPIWQLTDLRPPGLVIDAFVDAFVSVSFGLGSNLGLDSFGIESADSFGRGFDPKLDSKESSIP